MFTFRCILKTSVKYLSSSLALKQRINLQIRMSTSAHPLAAVCQLTATPDVEANFSACKQLVEEAKERGASMVLLPEGFDYIGSSREETLSLCQDLEGDTISRYKELAGIPGLCMDLNWYHYCGPITDLRYTDFCRRSLSQLGGGAYDSSGSALFEKKHLHSTRPNTFVHMVRLDVWLSLGGFHERGHNWETDRRIYNSHIIINNKGDIVAVYRKSHLFDVELPDKGVSLKESTFTIPGPSLVPPVQTPIGKVGLGICYDLRFPELSIALQRQGAEILTYPSAFTVATGAAHWEVLLRARAIETQCYVLAAAQVGRHHDKRSSYGHAVAVDPWGEVVGDCGGENPGLVMVEIDLDKVTRTRRNMPVQQHRRDTGFYHSLEKT